MQHVLVVVHGTWGKSKEGFYQWSEEPASFCQQLLTALEPEITIENLTWIPFEWDPQGNNHQDRLDAADKLAMILLDYMKPDYSIHLIAHSHGGNVVLKVLDKYFRAFLNTKDTQLKQSLSPEDHHIGRIVFLGTPFYRRYWTRERTVPDMVLGTLISGTIFGLVFGGLFALPLLLVLLGIAAVALDLDFLEIANPLNWNTFGVFIYVAFSLIVGAWIAVSKIYRIPSNVYFDEYIFGASDFRLSHKIPVLTIHSGQLDEALLMLSSQPILDAFLEKPIAEISDSIFGARSVDLRRFRNRSGEDAGVGTAFQGFLFSIKHLLLMYLNHRLLKFLLEPTRRKVKELAKNIVLRVARGILLGLPPEELKDCKITVSESLKLDKFFDIESIDVSKALVSADRKIEPVAARIEKYAFLWDNNSLEKAISESETWNEEIAEQMKRLHSTWGKGSETFQSEIQKMILVAEVRKDEVTNNIALDHSAYYESPDVIETIAKFLTKI